MKKTLFVLLLLTILALTACENDPVIDDSDDGSLTEENLINNNDFLRVNEASTYTKHRYFLDVELDEESSKLKVSGAIIYVNDEMDFDELYLQLYPNARNDVSSGDNVTFEYLKVNDIEYNVVFSGVDDTVIHINLNETLVKDTNVKIEFKYEFNFWDSGRIAGYSDYFISMFFYPFVCVYDDYGWNIDRYTFRGESYYNEIGDYLVSINVPTTFKVAGGGKLLESEEDGSRTTYNYYLENGRDYSFSASELYAYYEKEINDIHVKVYTRGPMSVTSQNIIFDTIENSINTFETHIGDYPYDYFTAEFGRVYGMESSTIIYCSDSIKEETIIHEVLHQWFYSIIGNDQSDFSFIDESLTTFATGLYYYDLAGRSGADVYFETRNSMQTRLANAFTGYEDSNMIKKVRDYGDGYAYVIYYHGPTLFRHFWDEFLDGDITRLDSFLQEYYNTYKYQEVSLNEFLDLLESNTGEMNAKEWFLFMLEGLKDPITPLE